MASKTRPWADPMPASQFEFMRRVLAAPSPVGFEAAMTAGVLQPHFDSVKRKGWETHRFLGNAGVVLDTHPDASDRLTVMLIGHADKIRMQVRSIGDDGKIWINSDSFLPATLLGHEVLIYSRAPGTIDAPRVIEGGTVEAIGAIHFADSALRAGDKGIRETQLYVELQLHGDSRRAQVERLGIRAGDPILLNRPIRAGFAPNTFYGAYLDNGLGCFCVAEAARLIARGGGTKNVRVQFAVASHEEIGRMGSRVLAGALRPDVIIAIDVSHDYAAAPGISERRMTPLAMGAGFTLASGAVVSEYLNALIEKTAAEHGIPYQCNPTGRDTGTDGMAGVLASIDCAAASIGFPIRNMHTISESGHTGDILAALHVIVETIRAMDKADRGRGLHRDTLRRGHVRLDEAQPLRHGAG